MAATSWTSSSGQNWASSRLRSGMPRGGHWSWHTARAHSTVDEWGQVRVIGVKDPTLDVTDKLDAYARGTRQGAAACGLRIHERFPECGMERVKIYTEGGMPLSNGSVGLHTVYGVESITAVRRRRASERHGYCELC